MEFETSVNVDGLTEISRAIQKNTTHTRRVLEIVLVVFSVAFFAFGKTTYGMIELTIALILEYVAWASARRDKANTRNMVLKLNNDQDDTVRFRYNFGHESVHMDNLTSGVRMDFKYDDIIAYVETAGCSVIIDCDKQSMPFDRADADANHVKSFLESKNRDIKF